MKQGYVHPYHTDRYPIHFSYLHYMKTLWEAVGPEQVSPHYETLSRSRRGLIFLFLYIGSIRTISQMGGWANNEWIRGMVWHHEFLLAFYLGFAELRHFTMVIGPKFTVFYNVYSRYEAMQFANMWADQAEEVQHAHLQETKEQIEYLRIHSEYEFIKKRSMINFLTNERLNVEKHFHDRAYNMLNNIKKCENDNLQATLRKIMNESLAATEATVTDAKTKAGIIDNSFESALVGIKNGEMTYENDTLLPHLMSEIAKRTSSLKNLTAEQEREILQLTDAQKKLIAGQDSSQKVTYLTAVPQINNPGIKGHDKYKQFVDRTENMFKSEI